MFSHWQKTLNNYVLKIFYLQPTYYDIIGKNCLNNYFNTNKTSSYFMNFVDHCSKRFAQTGKCWVNCDGSRYRSLGYHFAITSALRWQACTLCVHTVKKRWFDFKTKTKNLIYALNKSTIVKHGWIFKELYYIDTTIRTFHTIIVKC